MLINSRVDGFMLVMLLPVATRIVSRQLERNYGRLAASLPLEQCWQALLAGGGDIRGRRAREASEQVDDGADEDVVPELQNALALGGTLTGAIVGTLANPNPSTLGTLKNTLQRGRLDISEFVDSEGPAALLDIVDEVASKPKMSWLDEEVRDGAQFSRRRAIRRNSAQFF